MGVTLQLILGIFLVLVTCSFAEQRKLRQIREAPPPLPAPAQNVTEINNRDLNKIVKDNPKTEALDSKAKIVNNVNNFEELPLKLGKSDEKPHDNIDIAQKNETEEEKTSKEVEKKDDILRPSKEKLREENSRAIDIDASKLWPSDLHSKDNIFTLSPTPNIAIIHPSERTLGGTRHPSFENNAELTTPSTKLFDAKFKETVESVEQNLEDVDADNDKRDSGEEENNEENLAGENFLNKKSENSSLGFENTKTIVNNETIEKNSIHKDLNIEKIKRAKVETTFNDTKLYDDESSKGETEISTTEKINRKNVVSTTVAIPVATTRKSALLKESAREKSASHILSNNIETEFVNPPKAIPTATDSSSTLKMKGDLSDVKLSTSSPLISTTESLITSTIRITTVSTPTTTINILDQENIIPLQTGTESTLKKKPTATIADLKDHENQKQTRTIDQRIAADEAATTTETIPSTTSDVTTDITVVNNILSDATTSELPDEGTTVFVIENTSEISDTTTETSEITTALNEPVTSDNGLRTSKSLEHLTVTEQMLKSGESYVESTTKEMVVSTESTIKNELDSTTLNNGKPEKSEVNIIQEARDIETTTVEEITISTATINEETTTFIPSQEVAVNVTNTTEKVPETTQASNVVNTTAQPSKVDISTEVPVTTQEVKQLPTTTEFSFVHIESTASRQTTLLPEILSPNLNYSTSMAPENERNSIRKIVYNEKVAENTTSPTSNSTSTENSTSEKTSNLTETTEDGTDTNPTENNFTKDGDGEGGNNGKIAAIVISSVGAACLILLAGLLYVMKKRQRRLNYGPRCRPVSLDDYSIDNLSVYNSVRRKGGARMSKRSFGNPAFEDPVAPTHPLNFSALVKFSTNFEDIKAEFEEIPQITARTSELPDGCDTKNRYANVIPLPETRVFLNPIDGYPNSDYINANYVTGPKNVKGYYIATQGPMENTVDDFWRMVWEQQTKVILMLTHLVENGLEKCVDYLPESEVLERSRLFGDFQITLKKREVKEKYIISSLQLKNMVSNSWREVTHFWYLGWPEKGVPGEANSLIAFLIEARSYMKTVPVDKNGVNGIQNGGTHTEHNPVVIHCSPGTGRTGVAIACDIAIRDFETTRLVDIPKIVYRIRRDRANAIQTKEQYMFIYKVVSLYATKLTGGALDNL